MKPPTYFTWNDGWGLAYQVLGEGPDLVYLPPYIGSVDHNWLSPAYARFLRRLASFSRVTIMDRRGWGASDRLGPDRTSTLDVLVDDLLAVVGASNATKATVFACGESGFQAIAATAAHPDLFSKLVLFHCSPAWTRKDDMPWEQSEATSEANIRSLERAVSWDDWLRVFARDALPSIEGDEAALAWLASASRALSGPGGVIADMGWMSTLDVRDRLAQIQVPTLLLHREGSTVWPPESGLYMADRIPDARFVSLPGADLYPWVGEWEPVTDEIQAFTIGDRTRPEPRRSLATVLFTDVVGSTVQAFEIGDAAWRELLGRHDDRLRADLRRHHGTEIDSAGDGLFATFATAAEAVRCGLDMVADVRELGLEIRVGVHTGEVEIDGEDLRGVAIHIGARVMSKAGPSEILVSSTVRDLAAGSGLTFEDAGEHELKGVPDRWHLYRVVPS